MAEKREISRATGIMGLATGLSRITGLVRDVLVARLFGAGFGTDAFFMAFTIPNLLRRFFAEGSLTAAFVPTFSEVLQREGREEALRVARACWTLLIGVMLVVTILGIAASPLVVRLIGYGFGNVEGKLALTDLLNRIMFPYIFFVSLLALLTGMLNVFGHYFIPALSPVLLNLAIVLSALFLSPLFSVPVVALAVGVLVGGMVQLLMQVPVIMRTGLHLGWSFEFRQPAVVQVVKLMIPGIVGVAIYQINVITTRLLASFLPEGSVSYLYYGQRLFEFPQGIFIASVAQAVLPPMSRQVCLGDQEGVKESLRFALSLILLVTLPATVGLMVCAKPIFSLLFMSESFPIEDVRQSAWALLAYAPGLLFVGASRVVVPTFYAMKNTRTPVWISFWTFLLNAAAGLCLMGPFGHIGLAFALTLSSVFNCGALLWTLRRRIGRLGLSSLWSSMLKQLPVALAMGFLVHAILGLVSWEVAGGNLLKGLILGSAILSGLLVYGGGCLLFRVSEVSALFELLRRRRRGVKA